MIFITFVRFKKKPTKELMAQLKKLEDKFSEEGGVVVGNFWTLGRFDAIIITEGNDEKAALMNSLRMSDIVSTETLIAVPADEAVKLLE